MTDARPEPTLTIAEAAKLANVSKATIRSRIARGTLNTVMRGGVHRISAAELARVGLIPEVGGDDIGEAVPLTVDDLLERLERQAKRIGQLETDNAQLQRALEREQALRARAERALEP